MPVFKAYVANDEQKRKEATEEYVNKTLDPFIQFLEKQLAKNGTKFLVGSQVHDNTSHIDILRRDL